MNTRLFIFIFHLSLLPCAVNAQGWQRFYGGKANERGFSLQLASNGDLVAAGSTTDTLSGYTDWYFFRTDHLGHLKSEWHGGDIDYSESAQVLLPAPGGDWFMGGLCFNPSTALQAFQSAAVRTDSAGSPLNVFKYNPYTAIYHGANWGTDYLWVGLKYEIIPPDVLNATFYYQKIDSAGQLLWQRQWLIGQNGAAQKTLVLPDGNAVIAGHSFDLQYYDDVCITKINASGGALANKIFGLPESQQTAALLQQGSKLILVANDSLNSVNGNIRLFALTENLDSLWDKSIYLPGNQQAHAATMLPDGKIAIAGEVIPEGSNSRDAFLALCDANGNLLWHKTYGGIRGDIFWDILPAPDGNGFLIAGQTASFSTDGNLQGWLLRSDSLGVVWNNQVLGRVFRDETENCVEDPAEPALPGWFVTVTGAQGTLYSLSDSAGRYQIPVDTGLWYVSVLPVAAYWEPCEDSLELNLQQSNDTISIDFPIQALYNCPLLDVDLTTPYLRRCYDNTFYVRYFNYGTSTAPDAYITVALDPYLSITGSTHAYTQSGDTLFFQVGAVPALTGGSFEFTTHLDCDSTVLGQTHCTEAHIYPDSLCFNIDPGWDGSNLEVDGYCTGDSVILRISNTGLDMQEKASYIIVEDQIIFKMSDLKLSAGEDTVFVLHPGGSTVTLIVHQTPGHPGNNQPMLVIEGCGGFPFSTGYALQFPQNDGDFSTDIECRQNIGSFDPNDKTGIPEGIGPDHVIAPETEIEYLIRFQNTGTDTAFRVEVVDTLPLELNPASFRAGASSHPYQLKINGNGILHFLFDPIALPDSNANPSASQGFVKFRIAPKLGLPRGTPIRNQAAIYFDHNAPVITQQTLHTIDDPFHYLITTSTKPLNTNTTYRESLVLAPNPAHENVTIGLARPFPMEGLRPGLYDALGRPVQGIAYDLDNHGFMVNVKELPQGLYFVKIENEAGRIIASGKFIKV